ncbi:MAG: hypothetical protein Q4C59_11530 [Lachnospiraceae bacterium]|nr:hypothetical protein [Lachnospiraceae bacterium]
MLIFWIFLITDLSMVGIFAAAYGGKYKYKDGMLFGVHVPPEAEQAPEVIHLAEEYRRNSRKCYIWNAVAAAAICFLTFWKFSVFFAAWTVWFFEFCVVPPALLFNAHRKMYDLKEAKQWFVGESVQNVWVDTKTAAASGKMAISHWYHLPVFLISLAIPFALPKLRAAYGNGIDGWLLPGVIVLLSLTWWGMHLWFCTVRNTVYSKDSGMNLAVNRMEKRTWSLIWLSADYLNLVSFVCLIVPKVRKGWIDGAGIFGFAAIQTVIAFGVILGALWIQHRKKAMLSDMEEPLQVDDDVYWKNGWYSNPGDRRLFVSDRMNSMNLTINMGRTSGKVLTAVTIGGTILLMLWMNVMFLRMEFTKIDLRLDGNTVEVVAGSYELSFDEAEIEELEILEDLPKEHLNRTNGMASDKLLLGKFRGNKSGDCRLYVYRKYTPILKIKLENFIIYINSRENGKVEAWYDALNIFAEKTAGQRFGALSCGFDMIRK